MEEIVEEVEVEGVKYKVTLTELGYKKFNNIVRKYVKVTVEAGVATVKDIDYFGLEEDIFKASIKKIEAPEGHSVPSVDAFLDMLPYRKAKKLKDAALKLNPLMI